MPRIVVFFAPNIETEGIFRDINLEDTLWWEAWKVKYVFTLRFEEEKELLTFCNSNFDEFEKTKHSRVYDITEEKLAMMFLQYA